MRAEVAGGEGIQTGLQGRNQLGGEEEEEGEGEEGEEEDEVVVRMRGA